MKIPLDVTIRIGWEEFSHEILIDIGVDDIRAALFDEEIDAESQERDASMILDVLNDVSQVVRAIDDSAISRMTAKEKEIVASFFREQAERYEKQED